MNSILASPKPPNPPGPLVVGGCVVPTGRGALSRCGTLLTVGLLLGEELGLALFAVFVVDPLDSLRLIGVVLLFPLLFVLLLFPLLLLVLLTFTTLPIGIGAFDTSLPLLLLVVLMVAGAVEGVRVSFLCFSTIDAA